MNTTKLKIYLLLFLFSPTAGFVSQTAIGSEQLVIQSEAVIYELNPNTTVYTTPDTLSGKEAWIAIQNGKMGKALKRENPGMNVKDQAFWLYFTIENQTNQREIYLEIDYPQLDYIQLVSLDGDSATLEFETGDKYPFYNRPIPYRNFILPITIKKGVSRTFLLNLDKRSSAIRFPIDVYSSDLFLSRASKENIYHGIYFGFFLLIFIISLLIGVFLKRLLFVWYSFYVLFFALWIFSRLGYSYQYIIPDFPEINTHFFPVITSSAIMFLILYVMAFFETKIIIPKFHYVMKGVVIFIISFFFLWAAIPDQFLKFAPVLFIVKYALTFLVIIFAYTAAFKFIKIDAFRGKIFIGAYSILFLGIASVIFGEYGLAGSTFLIDPFMLGFFVEVMLLTFLMIRSVIMIITQKDELSEGNQHLASLLQNVKSKKSNSIITLNSKAIIDCEEIRYIKSDDHYLEFYLTDRERPEVDRNSINEIRTLLPEKFIQIHRSYIVNIDFIKSRKSKEIQLKSGEKLPVSRTYKNKLEELI